MDRGKRSRAGYERVQNMRQLRIEEPLMVEES